ncbi:hypothetical protein BDN72DRAFT_840184 [Pluteus cervinus]|uniref:Uncharacterized protein n=1 Tax=Pluteus cervinus TaxID=181527 RepID=A0ACD3AWE2_9AGAR|nr:hypothetical protein BDN72DRAFT_840184 [Pluteus cervinus]
MPIDNSIAAYNGLALATLDILRNLWYRREYQAHDPIFPPEIEQIIFIHAQTFARRDKKAILNLVLVAKRVHTWLIPKLFETITFRSFGPYNGPLKYPVKWKNHDLIKYGKYTRNFFFSIPQDDCDTYPPHQYLIRCPNITKLFLGLGTGFLDQGEIESLLPLPLTHLSMDLDTVLGEPRPELIQLYSRVTHLESVEGFTPEYGLNLMYFTSLTHLAIPDIDRGRHTDLSLQILFKCLPTLRVLALLTLHTTTMGLTGEFNPTLDDPRIVRMTIVRAKRVDAWLLDVEEGRGMWGLADEAVGERKKLKKAGTVNLS